MKFKAQPSWSVLRDDFIMGNKLKDWENDDDEDYSENETKNKSNKNNVNKKKKAVKRPNKK
jgi:hypothetical protein